MSKLVVRAYSVSVDGFGAGLDQSLDNPLGVGAMKLHNWLFPTRMFQNMVGGSGGETGIDNGFAERAMDNLGAWILGRNMFAPSRGAWPPNDEWKGWWGDEPPYHCDVYILTHHARAPLKMEGGTTFYFVTDGIHAALERAKASAGGKDVRIGGGAATIRQYLQAGLVDEMHLAVSPVLLGKGEPLLTGIDVAALGFEVAAHENGEGAAHYVMRKR